MTTTRLIWKMYNIENFDTHGRAKRRRAITVSIFATFNQSTHGTDLVSHTCLKNVGTEEWEEDDDEWEDKTDILNAETDFTRWYNIDLMIQYIAGTVTLILINLHEYNEQNHAFKSEVFTKCVD